MSTPDINFRLGTDLTALTSGLSRARSQIQTAAGQIQAAWGGVQKAMLAVSGAMAGIAAVLAGGAAFSKAVSETVEWARETEKLARVLGISQTQASALSLAVDSLYESSDTVIQATRRLTETLISDERAFRNMGIATREANGQFRNTFDILLDVNRYLSTFKEGTDRNIEGQKRFGKAWQDIHPTIRLTTQLLADHERKARELGLLVGVESKERIDRYRAAMNDVGDVMKAVSNVIGQSMMRALTAFGEWIGDNGPRIVEVFRRAINAMSASFVYARNNFIILGEAISVVIFTLTDPLLSFSNAVALAFSGKFAEAGMALKNLAPRVGEAWRNAFAEIRRRIEETADAIGGIKDPAPPETPLPRGGGGRASAGGTGGSRMAQWQAELAEAKAAMQDRLNAEGRFQQFSLQQELEFWLDRKNRRDLSTEEEIALRRRVAELTYSIREEQFKAELAKLQEQRALFRANTEERIRIAQEEAKRIGMTYGLESKEYADAQREVNRIRREAAAQALQIEQELIDRQAALGLRDIERQAAAVQLRAELGEITRSQALAAEERFELERFAIQEAALAQRLAMLRADPDRDPVAIEQVYSQLEAIYSQHQARMSQIRTAAAVDQRRYATSFWQDVNSGMQQMVNGLISGTMRIRDVWRSLWQGLAQISTNIVSRMAADWITSWLQQSLGSTVAALTTIKSHAATAGAAAYASTAAIPIVGPALAPAAAAAAMAGAMSFASMLAVPSAEGGFDIPAGLNPLTQLHEREMVLPADIADPMRQMLAGGGEAVGRPINLTINALDGRSVERVFLDNPQALVKALRAAVRDGIRS